MAVVNDAVLGWVVKIQTTNPLDSGYFTVSIVATEEFSGLTDTTQFKLRVTCIRSITPSGSLADSTYFISDPSQTSLLPTFVYTPALCPDTTVDTISLADGTASPSSISLSLVGSKSVVVFETDPLRTGVFDVKVTVSDQFTLSTASITFRVTIKCTK